MRLLIPNAAVSDILNRIAVCESNNETSATNPASTAKGRFQFLDSTWAHYGREYWGGELGSHDVFDYRDSTDLAFYVASRYGYGDWTASIDCWGT